MTAPRRETASAARAGTGRAVVSKIDRRLLPLLAMGYLLVYIFRININFAALQLRDALGVAPDAYPEFVGLAAGIFFPGYFLFQVPSNLVLQRVGARRWLACILAISGLVSASTALLRSPAGFYALRFLLGVATSGFYPGALLVITSWYRGQDRARAMAIVSAASAVAGLIGNEISGRLMSLHGALGLAGWQWLFAAEGAPAFLTAAAIWWRLPGRPAEAAWLSAEEKAWLQGQAEAEAVRSGAGARHRLRDAFTSGRVWLLTLIYFLLNVGLYGLEFWLPRMVQHLFPAPDAPIGTLSALPYVAAAAAMVLVGRHSDQTGERRWHVAAAAFAAALGLALLVPRFDSPAAALAMLALALAGIKGMSGPFWALGSTFLSGTAAACGLAWINCAGNLGGFAGSYLVGSLTARTNEYSVVFAVLAAALLGAGALALTFRPAAADAERR